MILHDEKILRRGALMAIADEVLAEILLRFKSDKEAQISETSDGGPREQ